MFPSRFALALVFAVAAPGLARATTAADLCPTPGATCVISRDASIDDGSTLDFGTTDVTIARGVKLDVAGGDMTINAASLTLEPTAGLFARGTSNQPGSAGANGGTITVNTSGAFRLQASGKGRARIDVSAVTIGGSFTLGAGGDVEIDGIIAAHATDTEGQAGSIFLTAGGSLTVAASAQMTTFGGPDGNGEEITLVAAGDVVVSGSLDTHGGDGGDITITSGNALTINPGGTLELSATEQEGEAGSPVLTADRDLLIGETITAAGSASDSDSGSTGGDVFLTSSHGSITISAEIDVSGAGPDGEGGSIDAEVPLGDFVQTAKLDLRGHGSQGTGGTVTVSAGRNVTLGELIDVGGASYGGGDVIVSAGSGTAAAHAEIDGDADDGFGGDITIRGTTVDVTGNIHSTGANGQAGTTTIQACDVTLESTAQVVTRPGDKGTNLIQASGHIMLDAGSALLASMSNTLEFRPGKNPSIASGATVTPAATLKENAALPLCPGERPPNCGNHVVDTGEQCDDGNDNDCDGCSNQCQLKPVVCGDGFLDAACGEVCDDGNTTSCDGCSSDCKRVDDVCGDGITECGEQCDDHNTTSCDGCSALCRHDAACGDGVTECGEECDDGAANGTTDDSCDRTCHIVAPHCGDGVVQPEFGEECDDHNARDGDGCSSLCQREICGNNVIDPREECDDGNLDACDGCSQSCHTERCGNGFVDCHEECDDGNQVNGDGCDTNCTVPRCGNGIVDGLFGEECDHGLTNGADGDDCSATCKHLVPCADGQGFCAACHFDRDCDSPAGCDGSCVSGACRTVAPPSCDDGRRETRDACVRNAAGVPQCVHTCLNDSACDDGNACNGAEHCSNGQCLAGTPLQCNDDDLCTDDTCVPAVGCPVSRPFKTGFDGVQCRLDTIDAALADAGPTDIAASVAKKLRKARTQLVAKLAAAKAAGANAKKERKQLVAAKARLKSIGKIVGVAEAKSKISERLTDVLTQSTTRASDVVDDIIGGLSTPHR